MAPGNDKRQASKSLTPPDSKRKAPENPGRALAASSRLSSNPAERKAAGSPGNAGRSSSSLSPPPPEDEDAKNPGKAARSSSSLSPPPPENEDAKNPGEAGGPSSRLSPFPPKRDATKSPGKASGLSANASPFPSMGYSSTGTSGEGPSEPASPPPLSFDRYEGNFTVILRTCRVDKVTTTQQGALEVRIEAVDEEEELPLRADSDTRERPRYMSISRDLPQNVWAFLGKNVVAKFARPTHAQPDVQYRLKSVEWPRLESAED